VTKAFQVDAFQNDSFQTKFYKALTGVLNFSGSLVSRLAAIILAGTLSASSSLNRKTKVNQSGILNLTGAVSTILKIFKSLAGTLNLTGAMAWLTRIVGAGNVSIDGNIGINTFHLSKFTADFSGIVSSVKIYATGSINVKVAIYADVGGEPSSLLSVVNDSTALVAGWNSITIPSVSIVISTDYWMAFNSG
jgi:hypothetical protein